MIQELYAITASLVRFETAPHSPEDLEKELEYLESANRILQAAKRTLKVQFQYKNYSYAYALATQIKEAQIVYLRVHKCCVSQAQIELLQCARTRISDVQRVMRQLSLFTLCDLDIDRLQILRQCFTRIRTPRASEVVIAVQPTNTVLIRLREGQLPNELWDQVLSHIPEKQLRCLRRVDRHFNQVIEGVYFHAWRTLKHSPSKGLVDTRYLMGRIEGEFLGKSAVFWFKELKEEFLSLGAAFPKDALPMTATDLEKLQEQVSPKYERALFCIWRIARQQLNLGHLMFTGEEIKNWLNDPRHASQLSKITFLDLRGLRLEVLPHEIRRFTGLRKFYLDENALQFLPKEIGSLTHLQQCSCTRNKLIALPKEIGLLSHLETLIVYENSLKSLPEEIGLLKKLHFLDLSNNHFQSLPPVIGSLHLFQLSLWRNPLMFIRDEILTSTAPCFTTSGTISNFKNELAFPARSKLGKLYQLIIKQKPENEIKEAFFSLPPEEKNLTYEMVWFCAGSPQTEDIQWGEHHVFDDRDRFYLAVRKTISTKLMRLSIDLKERVYENVFRLTENPEFNEWIWEEAVHCKWGELFVYDNFPRLADAMALLNPLHV